MKSFKVSIVIPAYNEESHLRLCLEAIARQTAKPFEVIVVDNNSTDATAAIARSFPFVTLLSEKRQGVMYARDCGFDAARGEIIGRLDADSIVAPNWVETIQQVFQDESIHAATGTVRYREICASGVFDKYDFYFRSFLACKARRLGQQTMQGVNLAIRRSVWQKARGVVCHKREHHEDLDLAAHLAHLKQKVIFEPQLVVTVSFRQADADPAVFYHYVLSTPRTYRLHGLQLYRYMYFVAWLVVLIYLPIRIAYRAYNPATGKFSFKHLVSPAITKRVSPVATLPSLIE